jgi:hypothetical protein
VAASVTVTLDVTPPQVILGQPERLPGDLVRIPYVIDEPQLVSAEMDAVSATVGPAEVTSAQTYPAAATIEFTGLAVDDVGNQAAVSEQRWIDAPGDLGLIVVGGGVAALGGNRMAVV